MGGLPLTALNVVCYPAGLDAAILNAILRGGLSKLGEAGVALMGGHTVDDPELSSACPSPALSTRTGFGPMRERWWGTSWC